MSGVQQPLTFNDVFDDDDDVAEPKEAQTVHHIRANSSIMQLKKILGGFSILPARLFVPVPLA
jgi:pyruvate carboxylase